MTGCGGLWLGTCRRGGIAAYDEANPVPRDWILHRRQQMLTSSVGQIPHHPYMTGDHVSNARKPLLSRHLEETGRRREEGSDLRI